MKNERLSELRRFLRSLKGKAERRHFRIMELEDENRHFRMQIRETEQEIEDLISAEKEARK